jgi:hypothetical protein
VKKDDLLTNIIRHNVQAPIHPVPTSNLPDPPRRITMDILRNHSRGLPKQGKPQGKSTKSQTEKTVKFEFYLLLENGEDGPPRLPKRVDGPGDTLFDFMAENRYIKTLEFSQSDGDYCIATIESGFAEHNLNGFQFWKPKGSRLEVQGPPRQSFNLQYLREYTPSFFNTNS